MGTKAYDPAGLENDVALVVAADVNLPIDGMRMPTVYGPTVSWASPVSGCVLESETFLSFAFSVRSNADPVVVATRAVSIGCQLPPASWKLTRVWLSWRLNEPSGF